MSVSNQGGLLTDAVDQHPYCVLLLDEIEKAHPDLFNVLLQVMDHGKLTDHNGKSVNFRNAILVMTTNAGAADLAKPAIGFFREHREGEDKEAINRMFTPEFRNRLDAVIGFNALGMDVIDRVVDKFILQLEGQLAERGVTIELTDAARRWLGKKGYDPLYGARPLARVIQEEVKKPLADELLFGKLAKGGAVLIGLDEKADKLSFSYPDAPEIKAESGKKKSARKKRSWRSRSSYRFVLCPLRIATVTIANRLAELGITLPTPPVPVAAYVPFVRAGDLLFVSGQIPSADGKVKFTGKLGAGVDIATGQEAAKLCAINLLAQAQAALGSLEKVARVVRLAASSPARRISPIIRKSSTAHPN